jgi:hypothetical protein
LLGGTEASFPLALFTTLADAGVDELPLVTGVGKTGVVFFYFGVVLPTSLSLAFPLFEAVAFAASPPLIAIVFAAAILIAAVSSDGLNSSMQPFVKWYLTALQNNMSHFIIR